MGNMTDEMNDFLSGSIRLKNQKKHERMKYYGFMVNEFDGDVENLECEAESKPAHETCGWSYAKWFTNKDKRDSVRDYTIKTIRGKK